MEEILIEAMKIIEKKLESGVQNHVWNYNSAFYQLCNSGQIIKPLWASGSLCIKWSSYKDQEK